jgi:hypothetical protein
MNDFTKEELEKIFYCVDITSHIQDDNEQPLLDKLQSMIDNYCTQHTWIGAHDGIMFCYHCKVNKNDL